MDHGNLKGESGFFLLLFSSLLWANGSIGSTIRLKKMVIARTARLKYMIKVIKRAKHVRLSECVLLPPQQPLRVDREQTNKQPRDNRAPGTPGYGDAVCDANGPGQLMSEEPAGTSLRIGHPSGMHRVPFAIIRADINPLFRMQPGE